MTRDGRAVAGADAKNATSACGRHRAPPDVRAPRPHRGEAKWVQVTRLGNPLINEVIIPIGQKDKFNRRPPRRRGELRHVRARTRALEALNALFGLGVKATRRTDIVQALLTGFPGPDADRAKHAAADTLKLNLGVPAAANPNRFGLLAGDAAGFPNGRRLADDVTDIELRVIAGALLSPRRAGSSTARRRRRPERRPFRSAFPYVARPRMASAAWPSGRSRRTRRSRSRRP